MTFFLVKIFIVALAILLSQAEETSPKFQSITDDYHHPDKQLSLQKRSIYTNPLLVYRCALPLGLENGQVPDGAFSASSSYNAKYGPARARLNIHSDSKGYGAWASKTDDDKQWLQIDFGELVQVTKVATQGRQNSDAWVTKYTLSYSVDGMHWAEYKENSLTWVFPGNNDRNTVVEHLLVTPFSGRLIRFHPKKTRAHPSMRVEVYGCRNVHSCSVSLGLEDKRIPDSAFTASSSYDNRHRPSLARLNILSDGKHMGAWCPKAKSTNQWLQIDLGEFTAVTKVATQGRYNSEDRVKTYTLSYSVDGMHWTGYKQRSVEKVFAGNTDRNTVITHSLKPHIEARYIRLHPKTYNHNVPCLRAELYGCRTVKTCLMPVGAEDGRLPDEAFTASSSASSGFLPNRGRLNLLPSGGKYCWAAAKNDGNQWLQVKLGSLYKIRGVATQGRHDANQWVTSFSLAYTADDFNWVYIRENSQVKTFLGNSDKATVVEHFFTPDTRVFARSVRFHPKAWAGHISMRVEIYGCKEGRSCFLPLGMESGHLPDNAISASTYYDVNHIPQLSRLNTIAIGKKVGAWCTRTNNGNQWLQVYFGRETTVSKVATQGRYDNDYKVTSYSLSYSVDGSHWAWYRLVDGHIKVFGGNIDRNTPVYHSLHSPIQAKYLRFHPKTWLSHICMRGEVYGCKEGYHCSMSLGMEDGRIQDSAMTASTIHDNNHAAKLGRLNLVAASSYAGAWCVKRNDVNQWLQIDLVTPTAVTKVATQGRQDASQWVTSYWLSYSITGSFWVKYTVRGKKKIFRGNFDRDTMVVHKIFPPFHARFVRIHPLKWHSHISMRAELFGCPIKGI
ncbi:hypothetical protein ACROYT_G016139 [Oculina patagonica]